MFKEIIFSAAIILGFFLNLFFVEHPNVTSYTITFAISMVVISPVALWWKYRSILLARRAEPSQSEEEHEQQVSMGALVVSDALCFVAPVMGMGLTGDGSIEADVEKGVKSIVVEKGVGSDGS
jgi:uncharacterized membrane protein YdfJ with MMPL/SSD domain